MPQLIFYALVGFAGWYGYKVFKREMAKVAEKVRSAEEEQSAPKVVEELEQDPETGVYRPKKD